MPRYYVERRDTGEAWEVEAAFAKLACEKLGWMIGMCYINIIREGPETNGGTDRRVKMPNEEPE